MVKLSRKQLGYLYFLLLISRDFFLKKQYPFPCVRYFHIIDLETFKIDSSVSRNYYFDGNQLNDSCLLYTRSGDIPCGLEGMDSDYPELDSNELKVILDDHWFNMQGNPYLESTLTRGNTFFLFEKCHL